MAGITALHRQLRLGTIFVAVMRGMSLSISLQQEKRATPGEELKHVINVTTPTSAPSTVAKLGDNVQVYAPQNSQPVGSLILLMGIGGDHSWTMSQWWYLDTAWKSKEQEWCCKDVTSLQCTCWFDDNDKAAVKRLRDSLRVVDAVGKIWYRNGNSWYKYQWWPDGPPVVADHEAAIANVFQIIEHEYNIVGSYNRIALAGMSQGADLALSVGVRYPHQLGMILSQRGMLLEPSKAEIQANKSSPGTPFILTGGDADELIPLSTFKSSCASLRLMKTPTYLKTHVCYDDSWGCHGGFMKTEWKLLVNAFSLMLYPVHERKWEDQIGHLTFWNSCEA